MARFDRKLLALIERKKARIGIIGLGYVGLPLAIRFCEEGFRVTGFDTDIEKVERINGGRSYIRHIPPEKIEGFVNGRPALLQATTDGSRLGSVDVMIICVPTPLSDKREPDLRFVYESAAEIAKRLRPGVLVSMESTTYPGTTEEVLCPLFNLSGLRAGRDYFLVFSPEREDPGRMDFTTRNTPKIVGGITPRCADVGAALYSSIIDNVVPVSTTRVAEMSKLLENIYRSVNIALVNELKMLCDRMRIDVWEVIKASQTKPFGFQAFYPGPGLGGHCIPIDPFYLTWKAREYDFSTRFIELAGEINTNMPYYVVNKVMEALNRRGKSIKGSKVLLLGLAYKKDVDDLRESPSIELVRLLREKGARVSYNDPHVPAEAARKKGVNIRALSLNEKNLKSHDCVLIATDHTCYDYRLIVEKSRLVIDTRNATANLKGVNVVKA